MSFKPLTYKELSAFCDEMSVILKSGISVLEGLDLIISDTDTKQGREILNIIKAELEKGSSFYNSLVKCNVFPNLMLNFINIGEVTGNLDNVMASLSNYYENEENIKGNIKTAIRYPLIMIIVMFAVILTLVIKVLPVFNQIFLQLGSEMNSFTKGIMNAGAVIAKYSGVFFGFIIVLLCVSLYFFKTENGKKQYKKFSAEFFLTKNLYRKIAASQIANAMSLTISGGLDTDESFDMIEKLIEHPEYSEKIKLCKDLALNGEGLGSAIIKSNLFSGIYGKMIALSFKSGNSDEIMKKIALKYNDETQSYINEKISLIEPTLVAIFSIIVGVILLSVMLPLMGIMASIG